MRLSHVFRGEIFNPIIVVGTPDAHETARRFRTDLLVGLSDDAETIAFTKVDHLPWPLDAQALFSNSSEGPVPNFLDVSHEILAIAEKMGPEPPGGHAVE
jgi:hypothetical protein